MKQGTAGDSPRILGPYLRRISSRLNTRSRPYVYSRTLGSESQVSMRSKSSSRSCMSLTTNSPSRTTTRSLIGSAGLLRLRLRLGLLELRPDRVIPAVDVDDLCRDPLRPVGQQEGHGPRDGVRVVDIPAQGSPLAPRVRQDVEP